MGERICNMLAEGWTLNQICEEVGFPKKTTVLRWLRRKELDEFRCQYARAREDQADHWADELIDIADDGRNDWMTIKRGGEDVEVPNPEVLQRSRLRVDTRKFLMSVCKPKKYGTQTGKAEEEGSTSPTPETITEQFLPRPDK